MRYSLEPRDWVYVKGYGFISFARSMSNRYWKKLLDTAKKSATDAIKTASKRTIQKTAEVTGDLIGNKIVDKISVSTELHSKKPNNNNNNEDAEITAHKKRYISPEERQQIINELRLVPKKYVWIKVNIKKDNKLFIN